MTPNDVLSVLDLFAAAGVDVWIGGGWGVDALVGRQTRTHQDLDLMFDQDLQGTVIDQLRGHGFVETLDWRPGRFVMSDPERELDLHPIEFLPGGSAIQRTSDGKQFHYPVGSLTTGTIDGREVLCITAELQWELHQGYEPGSKDWHDMDLLSELIADTSYGERNSR